MMALPDGFDVHLAALQARLPIELDVRWFASVDSTMDRVAAAVGAGAAEGLVVVADEQTAGRGRRGRGWASPPGAGLYLSILLRPCATVDDGRVSLITLAAGVGVGSGIRRATGLAPDLKWPNDLLVGGRKVGGILAEGLGIGTPEQAIVLGIGVNLLPAAYPADLAARTTTLESELGRSVDRGLLLAGVLEGVFTVWRELAAGRGGDILQAWRAAAPRASGAAIEWDSPTGPRAGVTAGVDETGALLAHTADGVERIIAGEVRWL